MQISTSLLVASVLAIARLGHSYCFLINTATWRCLAGPRPPAREQEGTAACPAGTTDYGVVEWAEDSPCDPDHNDVLAYDVSRCCQ
ncbi:hypothetical protein BST61_g6352 [Cercospora zeina]